MLMGFSLSLLTSPVKSKVINKTALTLRVLERSKLKPSYILHCSSDQPVNFVTHCVINWGNKRSKEHTLRRIIQHSRAGKGQKRQGTYGIAMNNKRDIQT